MPGGPFEEGHSKPVFHPANLPCNGALGEPRAFGCLREGTRFGNQLKEGQLVEIEGAGGEELIHKYHQTWINNEFNTNRSSWENMSNRSEVSEPRSLD